MIVLIVVVQIGVQDLWNSCLRVRIPPVAAVCQLSLPSLRGLLMSTSESWGVNRHITRCTSSVSVVLQLMLVSGWGLQETEISAALWALEAREELYFTSASDVLFVGDWVQLSWLVSWTPDGARYCQDCQVTYVTKQLCYWIQQGRLDTSHVCVSWHWHMSFVSRLWLSSWTAE